MARVYQKCLANRLKMWELAFVYCCIYSLALVYIDWRFGHWLEALWFLGPLWGGQTVLHLILYLRYEISSRDLIVYVDQDSRRFDVEQNQQRVTFDKDDILELKLTMGRPVYRIAIFWEYFGYLSITLRSGTVIHVTTLVAPKLYELIPDSLFEEVHRTTSLYPTPPKRAIVLPES
ncbi:MAG: hypothetical protein Q7P63_00155 [Verrucomicrobiota bacterium JB022]|nr:hypothetical protein [Verrucomicrobiota bacterium JB022]